MCTAVLIHSLKLKTRYPCDVVSIVIIFLIYDDLGQVTDIVDASDSINILHSLISTQTAFF